MKNTSLIKHLLVFVLILLTGTCFAQGSGSVLVTVNGTKITAAQLDQFIALATTQGAQDTPELRQNFLNDLIVSTQFWIYGYYYFCVFIYPDPFTF